MICAWEAGPGNGANLRVESRLPSVEISGCTWAAWIQWKKWKIGMVETVKHGKKRGIGMTMTHSGQPARQVDFQAHAWGLEFHMP